MSDVIIPYEFLCKGGTAAAIAAWNGIPRSRQLVVELDTGLMKIGDGLTAYNSLQYVNVGFIDFTGISDGDVVTWDAANSRFKVSELAADAMSYDNTASGLAATDVQDALDELAAEKLDDAPSNGTGYVRKDGAWAAESGGGGAGEGFDPALVSFKCFDFESPTDWSVNGAGGLTTPTPTAGRVGVQQISTGTSSTGFKFYYDPAGSIYVLGGGEVELHYGIETEANLSNGTNRYNINAGLRDGIGGAATNGLYVRYRDDENSGNWTLQSIIGGVNTFVSGSTGPAASTRYRIRIVVNAAGTSATAYVRPYGGSEVTIGTTTAIPTAALSNVFVIAKNTGTVSRTLNVDFAARWFRFSPGR